MRAVRRAAWIGLGVGVIVLLGGLALVEGSAIAAGDWWLAREPWIGVGLQLTVIGLGLVPVFTLVLLLAEPLGWWRLLSFPPAFVVGFLWFLWLAIGLPTTGHGGPETDIAAILYSVPELLVTVVVGTVLMALPLAVVLARRARERRHA
jgi:hypothetical protein